MGSIKLTTLFAVLLLGFSGCGIYNFQGGTFKTGIETVSFELIENNANQVVPTLAQDLTEGLKDRFQSQSNLRLVNYDGHLQFSGTITAYTISPVAIQGDETAAQNRLTITIRVNYDNTLYPEDSWKQNFSQFNDYDSSLNLSDVESELVVNIIDLLTQDVFNKVLSNW